MRADLTYVELVNSFDYGVLMVPISSQNSHHAVRHPKLEPLWYTKYCPAISNASASSTIYCKSGVASEYRFWAKCQDVEYQVRTKLS